VKNIVKIGPVDPEINPIKNKRP